MPSLEDLKERYRDEPFKVVLINVREKKKTVERLFELTGIDLQILLDPEGRVSRDYHVSNHPIKFLIDRQGSLLAMGLGYRDWNSEEIHRLVNVLIKSTGETPEN